MSPCHFEHFAILFAGFVYLCRSFGLVLFSFRWSFFCVNLMVYIVQSPVNKAVFSVSNNAWSVQLHELNGIGLCGYSATASKRTALATVVTMQHVNIDQTWRCVASGICMLLVQDIS